MCADLSKTICLSCIADRLDEDYEGTCEALADAGYIFVDEEAFDYYSNLYERSGKCISTEGDKYNDFTALEDDFDRDGYHFSLKLYDLLGNNVDLSTVECYDFHAFVDELEALLDEKGVIMQTWKYKDCSLLPAPVKVWEGNSNYGDIYKKQFVHDYYLENVANKIKDLAISYLVWCELEDDESDVG